MKLEIKKNFVKAFDKNVPASLYLKYIFPNRSDAKLKKGIFVGPKLEIYLRIKILVINNLV